MILPAFAKASAGLSAIAFATAGASAKTLATAGSFLLGCLVSDSQASIDAWLRRQEFAPVATAYSERFRRQTTLWRAGDRYALVMRVRPSRGGSGPDRGRACVVDMGREWQKVP